MARSPYNFDGLTYATGAPARPLAEVEAITPGAAALLPAGAAPVATMDHRGLVGCGETVSVIGGMVAGPMVSDGVWTLRR